MPYEILTGPHPNLMIIRVYGDLAFDNLNVNARLGLGSGKPLYLLADLSEMNIGVPEDFLESAPESAFSHPDVKHTAIFLKPGPLAALARLVPKLVRQEDRVTTFTNREKALSHLLTLIQQAGL